ncbi:hypothetical protein Tco_1152659 [Tanacetum coccineum]
MKSHPKQLLRRSGRKVRFRKNCCRKPLLQNMQRPKTGLKEEVAAMGPHAGKRQKQMRRKRVNDEAEANAPPKVLRKDHVSSPAHNTHGGKSLVAMGLGASSITPPVTQETPMSDPNPLSYAKPRPVPQKDVAQSLKAADGEDSDSEKSTSSTSMRGSPGSTYQQGWGVTNNCRLDTPDVCQDVVDHIVPPGYFLVLRHLPNDEFLNQYNINLARQVAMGSQLRLRFEQEVRLLKKAKAQIAKRDQSIQAKEEEITKLDQEIQSFRTVEAEVHGHRNQIKNLRTLLEAEVDMKKVAEAKNAELTKELESLRVQQGEDKGRFEEFKKYEDDRVEQRCAEMDARLDALNIDFNEELYPHMLVIRHDLRLAVMKCAESTELRWAFAGVVSVGIAKGMSEGLKHAVEHGKANVDLAAIEAYEPEADAKYVAALHALKDLKYPLVDQLEKLKDSPWM